MLRPAYRDMISSDFMAKRHSRPSTMGGKQFLFVVDLGRRPFVVALDVLGVAFKLLIDGNDRGKDQL